MKNIKKILLAFFCISIIVTACNKEKNNAVLQNKKSTNTQIIPFDKILQLGEIHNAALDKIFDNFDINADDLILEMDNAILSTEFDGVSDEEKEFLIEYSNRVKNNPYTETDLFIAIQESSFLENKDLIINFLENINLLPIDDETTIDNLFSYINEVEVLAFDQLSNPEDLCVVIAYSELLKSSLKYWFPEDAGGIGRGFNILNSGITDKSKKTDGKGKQVAGQAALADCEALGAGMLATAIVGAIAPPASVVGLVSTAVGAGISSGWAAIKEAVTKKTKR